MSGFEVTTLRSQSFKKLKVFAMFAEPCFHETIVITVPLGPSRFLKAPFDGDLCIFYFVVFLRTLCYVTFTKNVMYTYV